MIDALEAVALYLEPYLPEDYTLGDWIETPDSLRFVGFSFNGRTYTIQERGEINKMEIKGVLSFE